MGGDLEEISRQKSLGAHLITAGKLSSSGLERAWNLANETGERFEAVLTKLGLMTEHDLAEEISNFFGYPMIRKEDFPSMPLLDFRINQKFIKRARFIPIEDRIEGLVVAMADPLDTYTLQAIEFAVGKPILPGVACPTEIDSAYESLFGKGKSEISQIIQQSDEHNLDVASDDVDRLNDMASDAPVIRLVDLLIVNAVEARASDIHIEPMEGELRVRYRIDGVLHEAESPPQQLRSAVISRVKIMARLNIAERRLAQDGRIRIAVRGSDIDFRVSTTPTIHGESVVLRILDRGNLRLNLPALGLDDENLLRYREVLNRPHGIVLVTGPTGSGKTTTLYASLLELNTPERKILTVEDPVEYQLKGVNQVQVQPEIGRTFASTLRSFLRQDPDIMMIGEIRDLETAQIAIQASLTGHIILATLHTNDAASAITRLLDMGAEDYLLTSTIHGIVAQRLVRVLCNDCREPYRVEPALAESLQLDRFSEEGEFTFHRAVGCSRCNDTGFLGRLAILEMLVMSDAIRRLVLQRAEARLIHQAAIEEGMQTMYICGMRKVIAGVTSVEEVLRVIREF